MDNYIAMSLLVELGRNKEVLDRLSRPLKEALFSVAVLKKLKNANISTLNNRIKCQKIIYLSSRMGISPRYSFNLYIHGPYSPGLASDLYVLSNRFAEVVPAEFISEETEEAFEKLKSIVSEITPRELEVISTLDFFKRATGNKSQARKSTMKIKEALDEELDKAERRLEELGLW